VGVVVVVLAAVVVVVVVVVVLMSLLPCYQSPRNCPFSQYLYLAWNPALCSGMAEV
jgi:hypothetical protein